MTSMQTVYWDSHCEPIRTNLAKIIYDLRRDGEDDLLMDSVEPRDFYQEYGRLEFDALVTPYSRIERKMQIMRRFLDRASDTLKVRTDTPEAPGLEITQPFKRNGTVQVAAIFYLTDGQTITIMFHNPDTTPGKLAPNDALVSWKWMINKKDVTIAVAPESGKDLDVNEVGRRIMKLAEKNSKAFQRANVKRTERLARLEANDKMIADQELQINKLLSDLQAAKDECEAAEMAYNEAKKAAEERAKAEEAKEKDKPVVGTKEEVVEGFNKSIESGRDDPRAVKMIQEILATPDSIPRWATINSDHGFVDASWSVSTPMFDQDDPTEIRVSFGNDWWDYIAGVKRFNDGTASIQWTSTNNDPMVGKRGFWSTSVPVELFNKLAAIIGMKQPAANKISVQKMNPEESKKINWDEDWDKVPLDTPEQIIEYADKVYYWPNYGVVGGKGMRLSQAICKLGKTFSGKNSDGTWFTATFRGNQSDGSGKWYFKNYEGGVIDGKQNFLDTVMEAFQKAYENGSLIHGKPPIDATKLEPLNSIEDIKKFTENHGVDWWNYQGALGKHIIEAMKRLGWTDFKGYNDEGGTFEHHIQPDGRFTFKLNGIDMTPGLPAAVDNLLMSYSNGSLTKIGEPDKKPDPSKIQNVDEMLAEAEAVRREEQAAQTAADQQWESDKAYLEKVIAGIPGIGTDKQAAAKLTEIVNRVKAQNDGKRKELATKAVKVFQAAVIEAARAAMKRFS